MEDVVIPIIKPLGLFYGYLAVLRIFGIFFRVLV
jgi:hypothetical protein